jgi:hypothetical protein
MVGIKKNHASRRGALLRSEYINWRFSNTPYLVITEIKCAETESLKGAHHERQAPEGLLDLAPGRAGPEPQRAVVILGQPPRGRPTSRANAAAAAPDRRPRVSPPSSPTRPPRPAQPRSTARELQLPQRPFFSGDAVDMEAVWITRLTVLTPRTAGGSRAPRPPLPRPCSCTAHDQVSATCTIILKSTKLNCAPWSWRIRGRAVWRRGRRTGTQRSLAQRWRRRRGRPRKVAAGPPRRGRAAAAASPSPRHLRPAVKSERISSHSTNILMWSEVGLECFH